MRKFLITAALGAVALATPAHANLNVFACEPEWGALSSEIGGDKVSVYTATTGAQDPHQIQARPSLIAKAHTPGQLRKQIREGSGKMRPFSEKRLSNPDVESMPARRR